MRVCVTEHDSATPTHLEVPSIPIASDPAAKRDRLCDLSEELPSTSATASIGRRQGPRIVTHFEELKTQAPQHGVDVGTINGEQAIILRRDATGHVQWYLYSHNGEVECIGPRERDDTSIGPRLRGKSLGQILELLDEYQRLS
jgi:hypothetical protein